MHLVGVAAPQNRTRQQRPVGKYIHVLFGYGPYRMAELRFNIAVAVLALSHVRSFNGTHPVGKLDRQDGHFIPVAHVLNLVRGEEE